MKTRCSIQPRTLCLELFHQRVRLSTAGDVNLVPDRQNTGYHRPGILADLLKIQSIDLAYQSDQFHVQVNGVVITAPQLQIGKCIALGELEGQKGVGLHSGFRQGRGHESWKKLSQSTGHMEQAAA